MMQPSCNVYKQQTCSVSSIVKPLCSLQAKQVSFILPFTEWGKGSKRRREKVKRAWVTGFTLPSVTLVKHWGTVWVYSCMKQKKSIWHGACGRPRETEEETSAEGLQVYWKPISPQYIQKKIGVWWNILVKSPTFYKLILLFMPPVLIRGNVPEM